MKMKEYLKNLYKILDKGYIRAYYKNMQTVARKEYIF